MFTDVFSVVSKVTNWSVRKRRTTEILFIYLRAILRNVFSAFALEQQHCIPLICNCHVFMLICQVDISPRNRVIHRINFQQISF